MLFKCHVLCLFTSHSNLVKYDLLFLFQSKGNVLREMKQPVCDVFSKSFSSSCKTVQYKFIKLVFKMLPFLPHHFHASATKPWFRPISDPRVSLIIHISDSYHTATSLAYQKGILNSQMEYK